MNESVTEKDAQEVHGAGGQAADTVPPSADAADTDPPPADTAPAADATTSKQSPQALAPQKPIPKLLHIVWVGPHRPPTEMIETWTAKHGMKNGWTVMIHRDHIKDTITGLPWYNADQIRVRANKREWNGVADIMRYEILVRYGGIAIDADSECVKSLDEGPEDFLSETKAIACYEHEHVRPGVIGCGFLGARPEHPFFKACIADVATRNVDEQAWKAVGPMCVVRMAEKHPGQLHVYPAKMFNPVHYTGAAAPGDHAIYARQGWGSTKGYNALRKTPCSCPECAVTAIRPPWG